MIEHEENSACFTDSRDGRKYRTVKIGGKTWMAQNLNYQPQTGNSWVYGDDDSNGDKYGRLYDWDTAKSVCPDGWRLPTRQEWADAADAIGGGGGADGYGFSALPGGRRVTDGSFYGAGDYGYWWTATEDDGDYAFLRYMSFNDGAVTERNGRKKGGLSVRCVQG